jgi:hypothetical protein
MLGQKRAPFAAVQAVASLPSACRRTAAIRTASHDFAAATPKKRQLAALRYGREVECTALEVWHERKPIAVRITYPHNKLCLPPASRLPHPAASAFFNASMK